MLLYTFYLFVWLLTSQHCIMWVDAPPNREDVARACGAVDPSRHQIRVVDSLSGSVHCQPLDVFTLAGCDFSARALGEFRIVVMTRPVEVLACAISIDNDQPAPADWAAACPDWAVDGYDAGRGRVQFIKAETPPPPPPLCARIEIPSGPGLYEQPTQAAHLATDYALNILAGKLLWHGIVQADCNGYSGITDAVTHSVSGCGLESARETVIRWQNRFDEAIYAAAVAEGVPARLLKAILIAESQTWTMLEPGVDGEIGPFQITDNGLDTLLRYTDRTYAGTHPDRQFYARAAMRDALRCDGCDISQADAHLIANMRVYAALLAAYRCQVNSGWPDAARAWNVIYLNQDLLINLWQVKH